MCQEIKFANGSTIRVPHMNQQNVIRGQMSKVVQVVDELDTSKENVCDYCGSEVDYNGARIFGICICSECLEKISKS